ncbi:protein SMG5 [Teleopsis dalmanni]|uniref:protein SMG5 n=1 Tax=Teleopsis dalmanni TaxID=139649 RepID=UPI0018CEF24C|nr:protein SMG5 [Teleopsis dalmanni]
MDFICSSGSSNNSNGYSEQITSNKVENEKTAAKGITSEIKAIYRSLYIVAKQLDDGKKNLSSIAQLFAPAIQQLRVKLVNLCKDLVFKDHQVIGKKAREIMWRKGYYEFIAYAKRNWHREYKDASPSEIQEAYKKLECFLLGGIRNYKRVSAKMEEVYDLDLKNLIDFKAISDSINYEISDNNLNDCYDTDMIDMTNIVADKSLEAISFALDTIHSSLLSLGDLHRYFLDFHIENRIHMPKQQAAKYYFEAFKLNSSVGMAQNQLGTLYYGQNYDLDSIYHYLYSLVCIMPFELSENNVCKLFSAHSAYLGGLDPEKIEFCLEDFYARFYLVVDIFFFDKEVPDFNSLCHCVLVDLRKVLCSKAFNITDMSIFKIVSILFFCLSKLKMINSQKVYSLNAFLVAVCSDLIDACIVNLEQTILTKSSEIEDFQTMYMKKFDEFDMSVRKSRNEYKNWMAHFDESDRKEKKPIKLLSHRGVSSDSRESQLSHDEFVLKTQDSNKQSMDGGDKNLDPISTRSSDEAKESDLKTPLSCKSKKRGMKLRRRRRKIVESDDSSCYDTQSEMDTDFSTDEEDYTDLSSNFDTDFSDIEADPVGFDSYDRYDRYERDNCDDEFIQNSINSDIKSKLPIMTPTCKDSNANDDMLTFSDNDEVVVEEEHIIYPINPEKIQQVQRTNSAEVDSEELLHSFEVLQLSSNNGALNFKCSDIEEVENDNANIRKNKENRDVSPKYSEEPPKKLVYRNKYMKINPNVVVNFAINEPTLRALKILFDWLRLNHEILFGCYHSNPEFVHKIMKLLNYCNIDIFTRKVYFEREFLQIPNVRTALTDLFDVRANIPLSEDFVFKNFDIFQATQITFDWEVTQRENITNEEESILRIFKMVDFGFFICKQKKFSYRFCVKSRRFTETAKKKREEKKSSRRRERRTAKNATRKRTEGRTRRYSDRKNGIIRKSYTSNEEKDTVEEGKKLPRKGYLRNRNSEKLANASASGATNTSASTTNSAICEKVTMQSSSGADEERSETMNRKCEIMGKLWLKNEVATLEEELRLSSESIVTPFIVLDTKALTEFTDVVKNLLKTKQFIILIPNSVINDLDDLKKRSENARNVIRWLEHEFTVGNRFLRAQRDNENLPLPLLKLPKKMDRDTFTFIQIVNFCNHLVANYTDGKCPEFGINVVTYLSGDTIPEKQRHITKFCLAGLLDAIPIRYEQISNYYAKLKLNKK